MKIGDALFWIGHASFYIKAGDTTIFIDPFKVTNKIKARADLVLVTHSHHDHDDPASVEMVKKDGTEFIGANKCLEGHKKLAVSKPGFKTKFKGIGIEAVPAYNTKEERLKFHPKSEGWVGYIIDVEGLRIYHAGDTDHIPEMGALKDIDIALLPMGGTYTMGAAEAIEAANSIAPKSIVPMHYKMLLGKEKSDNLEKELKSKLDNVMIMREVQDPVYSF
jgi:L-ascorbate metabolism protein UlaG (beta-lactamase superfamily)